MKIAQINSMLSGGGTDDQCLKLSRGLKDLGCAVIVVGPAGAQLSSEVFKLGLPLHVTPRSKIARLLALAAFLRRYNPDIVHVHHGRDYWPTIIARWLSGTGTRLVLSRHLAKSPSSWLSKKFLLRHCSSLVAVSRFVASVLTQGLYEPESSVKERRSRGPIEGDHTKIRVIYGGIDTERFRPFPATEVREAWGMTAENFIFAVIGAYDFPVGKGQREFLQAAALIHMEFPAARFLIIGRGTMRQALLEDITRLGLTEKAMLTPYCHDMPSAMNAINCLVHPAQGTEAFGLVLIEAFACGKPVIATRLDGIPEAFEFGQNGKLIDSVDPRSIAAAMRQLLLDKTVSGEFKPLEQVREKFSVKEMSRNYLELYRELCNSRGGAEGLRAC